MTRLCSKATPSGLQKPVVASSAWRMAVSKSASPSEVEIVHQNPLRIVLKSGTLAFNFPEGTAIEIQTPQLEIHPNAGDGNLSGIVTATPQTEDRLQSRDGHFTVVERQKKGMANHIMPGQILVAALIPTVRVSMALADPVPPAPQGRLAALQSRI